MSRIITETAQARSASRVQRLNMLLISHVAQLITAAAKLQLRSSVAVAGGKGAAWAVPLDSYAELDAVGRLRLLMRQSTEETLAADVDALLLPALQQLPPEERNEALQRFAFWSPDSLTLRRPWIMPA